MFTIEQVTKENFKDIPDPCRRCLYWQTDGFSLKDATEETAQQKLKSLLRIQKDTGNSSGFIAYHNKKPVGFVQWAPAKYFPQAREYEHGPLSEDAAFLVCLYIRREENRNKGLGTLILKAGISQIRQQGFKAIETFARRSSSDNPSGPLEFYLKNGFKMRRDGSDFPLVRLEL